MSSPIWKRRQVYALTWADVGHRFTTIGDAVEALSPQPEAIVAVARGGLPLGTVLAHRCRIRHLHVAHVVRNETDSAFSDRGAVRLTGILPHLDARGMTVLVADDIAGDGGTLNAVKAELEQQGAARVYLASIAVNEACAIRIDAWSMRVDDWVTFPWELPVDLPQGTDT